MTPILQKAFDRAAKLSAEAQDRLGAQLLTELEGDARWEDLFAQPQSESLLKKLTDAAVADHESGSTSSGGFGPK